MKSHKDLRKLLLVITGWFLVTFASIGQTINTTSLNPTSVCPGFTTVVSFTSAGTFNSGNIYTAQLSDGSGNFGSPTAIGTLNSPANGSLQITATIPSATPGGTGYLIRVVSSDPAVTSDPGLSVTIYPAPAFTVSPDNQTICSGATIAPITFSGSYPYYNWTRDNTTNLLGIEDAGPGGTTSIEGTLTNITSIPQTTNFTIVTVDANGCINTTPASVTVNPAPQIADIAGQASVCTGAGNEITLTDATGGGSWASSNPAIATVGPTGIVAGIANGSVIITYTVTNGLGCAGSVIKSINVNESPDASVSSGPSPICAGQSTTITGTASIAPSQIISFANTDAVSWDFRQGVPLTPLDKTMIINLSSYGITSLSQISSISVTVNVDHPRDQEVEMYLVAPGGVILNDKPTLPYNTPYTQNYTTVPNHVIPLVNNRGGSGSNFVNTVFVDGGASLATGTAPFSGSYQPEVAFSTLDPTINPNSVWTLRMVDEKSTGYTGRYRSFTISFTIPGTGSGTLQWTSNPVDPTFLATTSPGTYTVSPTQSTTYTLTALGTNGCSLSSSATITVLPAVVVNAGPDQNNCNNGSFTLAGNTPALGTGTWSR